MRYHSIFSGFKKILNWIIEWGVGLQAFSFFLYLAGNTEGFFEWKISFKQKITSMSKDIVDR